jgi:hypothetical protein
VTLQASAALVILLGVTPSSAIDLGETVQGATNTVSGAVSGATNGGGGSGNGTTVDTGVASATVGGGSDGGLNVNVSSGPNDGTEADVNLLGDDSVVSASVSSGDLLNADLTALSSNGVVKANANALNRSVKARLAVLTKRDLLKICLTIGGGPACGSGDRAQLLHVIETRLALLQPRQLLSLCLNIGTSGCGIVGPGNGGGGNAGGGGGGTVPPALASMSGAELAERRQQCEMVLKRPFRYEPDLVELCELLRDLNNPS